MGEWGWKEEAREERKSEEIQAQNMRIDSGREGMDRESEERGEF